MILIIDIPVLTFDTICSTQSSHHLLYVCVCELFTGFWGSLSHLSVNQITCKLVVNNIISNCNTNNCTLNISKVNYNNYNNTTE